MAARGHGRDRQFRVDVPLCLHRSAPSIWVCITYERPAEAFRPRLGPPPRRPRLSTGFWRRALRHRSFVTGGVLSLMVLGGPPCCRLVWTPWSAYEIDVASKLRPPSAAHWLGSRRAWPRYRLVAAGRTPAPPSWSASSRWGSALLLACASGWSPPRAGGWTEELIMRMSDFTFAFPAVLSAIMAGGRRRPGAW